MRSAFLLLLTAASGTSPDAVRGVQAVGERTSAEAALRAEGSPSADFALGASLRAWANAAAAVRYTATHVTGDGGDAEALAEACSDERIAFRSLETRVTDLRPDVAAARAGLGAPVAHAWTARRSAAPAVCP